MKKIDQGLLLSKIAFSETSLIVKIFTKSAGLNSFLVQGGKKKFNAILQIGTWIEFSYFQKSDELAKLYEPSPLHSIYSSLQDPMKSSIIFFQAELLLAVLSEDQEDEFLYELLFEETDHFMVEKFHANYLVYWLIKIVDALGLSPIVLHKGTCFDLRNGEINNIEAIFQGVIIDKRIELLCDLISSSRNNIKDIKMSSKDRRFCLEILLDYMKIQLHNFKSPKSLEVYHQIWI